MTPLPEVTALALRTRAVDALSAVLEELDLARPTAEMKASVIVASGSRETDTFSAGESARISHAIETRKLCVVDVIRALAKRGFVPEAENLLKLLNLLRLKSKGSVV